MKLHRCAHFLALAAALLTVQAQATDIYRWTDESGRVHIGDRVPERYRATATHMDSAQFLASEAELLEAAARAERDKARAAVITPDAPDARMQRSADRPGGAGDGTTPDPERTAAAFDRLDCATHRRLYQESQECFAPFLNVNGSLKSGAYAVCREVPDPTTRCGPGVAP